MNLYCCTTRLFKDAEQRFLNDGTSVVTFTGAVDSGFGDKKQATWIKFSLFGKRSESLLPYLKDKTQIAVHGELTNRKYQDKEGNDRYSLEVRVNDITLVGGRQESEAPQQSKPQQRPAPKKTDFSDLESDIPF